MPNTVSTGHGVENMEGHKDDGGDDSVKRMDVFKEYKPLRNRIASLARDDGLFVIWAYCQFLQIDDFKFSKEIEVQRTFLELDIPQKWISEWELELLAKEVILNGGLIASKGRTLRSWKTLSEIVNALKDLENRIYGNFGSQEHRGGPGCLNRFSASISGASAGVRLPSGGAAA